MSSNHLLYISRCLDLGGLGLNDVKKNPNVGALLVYNNHIIGEGYHRKYGGPHAEVKAFHSVSGSDQHLIKNANLYISLEPCCIHGKTPPCTERIIKEGVKKVVIATTDPNSKMNGKSITILQKADIEVISGLNLEGGQKLIAPFSQTLKGRPYIILKWAQSTEGYITTKGQQVKISNKYTDVLTHKWRSQVDGIMVGHNTVMIDNPRLDVRHINGRNPQPIIMTNSPEQLQSSYLFAQDTKPLIFDYSNINLMMTDLLDKGICRLLVEGGTRTHKFFINEGLWDEARIIRSQKRIAKGIRSAKLHGRLYKSQKVAGDTIDYLYRNH